MAQPPVVIMESGAITDRDRVIGAAAPLHPGGPGPPPDCMIVPDCMITADEGQSRTPGSDFPEPGVLTIYYW